MLVLMTWNRKTPFGHPRGGEPTGSAHLELKPFVQHVVQAASEKGQSRCMLPLVSLIVPIAGGCFTTCRRVKTCKWAAIFARTRPAQGHLCRIGAKLLGDPHVTGAYLAIGKSAEDF
jgi:hypothetical protein